MKWFIIIAVFFSILFISNSIYSYIFSSISEVNLDQKNEVYQDSFYDLSALSIDGKNVDFKTFKGKKVLIVNVASECGYTDQYDDLQYLHKKYSNRLAILGFPSNNFGKQEPGSNIKILDFCKSNFGVEFQMFEKIEVIGEKTHPVYKWLTSSNLNGWNDKSPKWNFYKYLVDQNGNLSKVLASSINPRDSIITDFIESD